MTQRPENPPAFPQALTVGAPGMSLRDWFAGQALAGFTSCSDGGGDVLMGAADTARAAYNYADAMLIERAKARGESPKGEA